VTANRYDYIQGVTGAYKSDNNLIKDKDDPVVPPMPVGPSQGGSPLNLFDLDSMRRQQALGVPVPAPAYVPQTQPQPQPQPPAQMVPAQPATSTPGVQP
jgi:general secretion pathway protein D